MSELFELIHTDAFAAQEALVPWVLPGTVASLPGWPDAEADIWSNDEGRLFVEFRCDGYGYQYELAAKDGSLIAPEQELEVCDFLQNRLVTWVVEGVDDDVLNM